jgi:hypothetical protein
MEAAAEEKDFTSETEHPLTRGLSFFGSSLLCTLQKGATVLLVLLILYITTLQFIFSEAFFLMSNT